jgi:hypothetical protein
MKRASSAIKPSEDAMCKVLALIVLMCAFTVSGNAFADSLTIAPKNKICLQLYQKYKKGRPHKAFALTGSKASRQACGRSFGYGSKQGAIGKALTICRAHAKKGTHQGPCRIFAAE